LIWGNRGGSGNWNREGTGRGRSVYKQPRKEEGFQVSRRDSGERGVVKGINKGNWQGEWQGDFIRGCAMT
jgi:hypothetical protein